MRVQQFGAGKTRKCCFKSLGLHSLRWGENPDYLPELKKALRKNSFIKKGYLGKNSLRASSNFTLFHGLGSLFLSSSWSFVWTENEEFQLELAAAGCSSEEIFCKHPFAHMAHPLPSDCSVATPSILFGVHNYGKMIYRFFTFQARKELKIGQITVFSTYHSTFLIDTS